MQCLPFSRRKRLGDQLQQQEQRQQGDETAEVVVVPSILACEKGRREKTLPYSFERGEGNKSAEQLARPSGTAKLVVRIGSTTMWTWEQIPLLFFCAPAAIRQGGWLGFSTSSSSSSSSYQADVVVVSVARLYILLTASVQLHSVQLGGLRERGEEQLASSPQPLLLLLLDSSTYFISRTNSIHTLPLVPCRRRRRRRLLWRCINSQLFIATLFLPCSFSFFSSSSSFII